MILVVDDDRDVREALCDVLGNEGYAVASAGNGQEALDYLRAHEAPRLILLDLMMPRMDGVSFRRAQQGDAAIRDIPVVLLSAETRLAEMKEALAVAGWLAKPVDMARLLDTIRRFY